MSGITSQARQKIFYIAQDGIVSYNSEICSLYPDAQEYQSENMSKPGFIIYGDASQLAIKAMIAGWKIELT